MILAIRLSFDEHQRLVLCEINKTIGLLCNLQCLIPTSALLTIYKTFVRLHLDYGDIKYGKVYNSSFNQKIESAQYNTCLAITGTIKGVSEEKLYDKLGLEPLQLCRWFRKSCYFYKSYKNESPRLVNLLVNLRHFPYNAENIPLFKTKHNFFKNSFFLQLLCSGTVFI